MSRFYSNVGLFLPPPPLGWVYPIVGTLSELLYI